MINGLTEKNYLVSNSNKLALRDKAMILIFIAVARR